VLRLGLCDCLEAARDFACFAFVYNVCVSEYCTEFTLKCADLRTRVIVLILDIKYPECHTVQVK